MSVQPAELFRRHRVSVAEYYRMAEVGLLPPEARVELIEGEVVDMVPIGNEHAITVTNLTMALVRAVGERARVSVQNPLRLSERSEPQPDLVVLRNRDDYLGNPPMAADALLVVEVSDSSAAYDLQVKLPLYAQHGVPEVWIIDLDADTVRRFRQPRGDAYLESASSPRPGTVVLAELPDVHIDLDAVIEGLFRG